MAFADTLIHACTIQRATVTEDAYKNDSESFNNWLVGVACRLMEKSEIILDTAQAQSPTVTRSTMFLAAGIDIQNGDRITEVTINEESLLSATFKVESILSIPAGEGEHHIELELQRVS